MLTAKEALDRALAAAELAEKNDDRGFHLDYVNTYAQLAQAWASIALELRMTDFYERVGTEMVRQEAAEGGA